DSIIRTQAVSLPYDLPAGDYRVNVTVDSFGEIVETSKSNNVSWATNLSTIPAQLDLLLGATQVNEGDAPFTCLVFRNGAFNQALAVTITNNLPDRLAVPNFVVIPAGRVF